MIKCLVELLKFFTIYDLYNLSKFIIIELIVTKFGIFYCNKLTYSYLYYYIFYSI